MRARREAERRVHFLWVEENGPPVAPPSSSGFGMALMKAVAHGMSGSSKVSFDRSGLRCEMSAQL
jgi:two-component sensor histidine kinase